MFFDHLERIFKLSLLGALTLLAMAFFQKDRIQVSEKDFALPSVRSATPTHFANVPHDRDVRQLFYDLILLP